MGQFIFKINFFKWKINYLSLSQKTVYKHALSIVSSHKILRLGKDYFNLQNIFISLKIRTVYLITYNIALASLVAQLVKKFACNVGDLGSISGLGRFPGRGHGNPFQYSCLENSHGQRSLVHSQRVSTEATELLSK